MRFKKGDRVCRPAENTEKSSFGQEYVFDTYFEGGGYFDCWIQHPVIRGVSPAWSFDIWFVEGRHVLSETDMRYKYINDIVNAV